MLLDELGQRVDWEPVKAQYGDRFTKKAKDKLHIASGRVDDGLMGGEVGDALVNRRHRVRTVHRACDRRSLLSCLRREIDFINDIMS